MTNAAHSSLPKGVGNVVITGGASGLGEAVAVAVRDAGGRPLVIDKDAPRIDCHHVQTDISDTATVGPAVDELARAAGGRVDAVFTAAGIDVCGPLASVSRQDWERVVSVDLLGTAAAVRACLPYLEKAEGRVVTCSSTLGIKAVPDATAYCAAKFGVVGFTRALAAETAGRIGVTLLIPSGMHTAFFDDRDEQYRPPPDAKLNRPEDVADSVMFVLRQPPGCEIRELVVCASEESSWP
ncbi:SDR family oxidoreductase [Tomitella gaofuii]|uniref:SDR family oxidoreductase n=1 Tax=Tomitella gaofuii TaxID=2760083 RepID=UPI0015FE3487|nr:SDR family oxidoreductase [Tomitella gaofuii]